MRTLVVKVIVSIVLVLALAAVLGVVASMVPTRHTYLPQTTSSITLTYKEPKQYDLMFGGTSHAKAIMAKGNHAIYEKELGMSIADLSIWAGGIIPSGVITENFFEAGNTCSDAIIFIDGHIFFSEYFNEKMMFLDAEPLSLGLLKQARKWGMDRSALSSYYQSKFRLSWLKQRPVETPLVEDALQAIDTGQVTWRRDNLYPDSVNMETAKKYAAAFEKFTALFKQYHCNVYFVMPPTLLGEMPGDAFLVSLLEKQKKEHGISYLNLSQAITDPKYFMDHDHLNTAGTTFLLKEYIKPLVTTMKAEGSQQP